MKLYLDTGNVDEIRRAAAIGIIDGVTTNPTLIAREGRDFEEVLQEIIVIVSQVTADFTVSAEVTATDTNGMVEQGLQLAAIDEHVLVKVPLTPEGLAAVGELSSVGIRCNVTLCFSANQALLAAKAGAWCVSPFVGRLDDAGQDGIELLHEIREIYNEYEFGTRILAASIRHPDHVKKAALAGADIATIPFKVYEKLFHHPLTDDGLAKFLADWKEYENR